MSAPLTDAERAAVAWFRKEHGRTWRWNLNLAWQDACQDIPEPHRQTLQFMRGSRGPSWLAKVKTSEVAHG